MSQKKTLLKYTKYVMWGTVALIPPAAFFYLLEFYTHNPFARGENVQNMQFARMFCIHLTHRRFFCKKMQNKA